MTSINYNEFQAGQGVSAPDLNENFTLTNNAIETIDTTFSSAIAAHTESIANLSSRIDNVQSVPVGTVIWFSANSVPDGYLLCNGSAIPDGNQYATLKTIVGNNVPDLINRWIMGSDEAGTEIDEELPQHTHSQTYGVATGTPYLGSGGNYAINLGGSKQTGNASSNIYKANGHVKPNSLSMLPCIKY